MEPCNRFKRDIVNRYLTEHNHYKKQYQILDDFIRANNLRCIDCDMLLHKNNFRFIENRCTACGCKRIVKFWNDHNDKLKFIWNHTGKIILIIMTLTLLTYILITYFFNIYSVQPTFTTLSASISQSPITSLQ